jgi:predicted AAA+ superfamily ATPase
LTGIGIKELEKIIGKSEIVIIDEAQRIKDVGITLKLITDHFPGIRLFVSGSSSLDLANEINEPLTGRKLTYQLFPLSFQEMKNHHGYWEEKQLLTQRLIFGYYPEIVTHKGDEIKLLNNLINSYLYKDILNFGLIKKPVVLDKLLRALALQTGSEVSYNELAQTVGADKETVERYIDLLEKSFIVFKLNAFNRNVRNEIKKGKKIYFYDNGIRNAIIGDFKSFELRTDKGALWENFIISERIKYLHYSGFYGRYYFWRTTQQQEIDFIEEIDGRFNVYEITTGKKRKKKISKTFLSNYPVAKNQIITLDNFDEFIS